MADVPAEKTDAVESKEIDLESARLEIAYHQLTFWRFFAWMKVTMQKTLIWGVFFLILYLLANFFPLIFLTFLLSFVSTSVVRALGRRLPQIGWRVRVVIVYVLFIALMSGIVTMLVPQVKSGVIHLQKSVQDFPRKWTEDIEPDLIKNSGAYRRILGLADPTTADEIPTTQESPASGPEHAELATTRRQLWDIDAVQHFIEDTKNGFVKKMPAYITDALTAVSALVMLLFLSTLFSFLIVLDLDGLTKEVKKLDETKLKGFYRETVLNIVKFGAVLGKVFEAQAFIAILNTVLTAVGLHFFFGLPHIAFLCLGVFICGFIPVAGVFISSVPICLVGLFSGGVNTFLLLVAFITLIHMIECYILNPRIMGATLHVNPVLVLMILVIGHHAMGVWGFLLGVPVCYYFFTYVIKREDREIGLRVELARRMKTSGRSMPSNPPAGPTPPHASA